MPDKKTTKKEAKAKPVVKKQAKTTLPDKPKNGHGGARPGAGKPKIVLSDREIESIKRMASNGLTQEMIADIVGISRPTIHNHPEFKAAYDKGKADGVNKVAQTLFHLATVKQEPSAVYFYLKTQGGFKETQKVELSGEVKAAVTFYLPDNKRDKK